MVEFCLSVQIQYYYLLKTAGSVYYSLQVGMLRLL